MYFYLWVLLPSDDSHFALIISLNACSTSSEVVLCLFSRAVNVCFLPVRLEGYFYTCIAFCISCNTFSSTPNIRTFLKAGFSSWSVAYSRNIRVFHETPLDAAFSNLFYRWAGAGRRSIMLPSASWLSSWNTLTLLPLWIAGRFQMLLHLVTLLSRASESDRLIYLLLSLRFPPIFLLVVTRCWTTSWRITLYLESLASVLLRSFPTLRSAFNKSFLLSSNIILSHSAIIRSIITKSGSNHAL